MFDSPILVSIKNRKFKEILKDKSFICQFKLQNECLKPLCLLVSPYKQLFNVFMKAYIIHTLLLKVSNV